MQVDRPRAYLVLIHPFDPRGSKVGGIETHVRQVLRHCPADMKPLLIGVDDSGRLPLGQIHAIEVDNLPCDFLPVVHIADSDRLGAASRLLQSVTMRFAFGLMRHVPPVRRALRGRAAVAEIERVELAPLVRALGLPFVLISHNEGDPRKDVMDSLLRRFWFVHALTENLAMRLAGHAFGVTAKIRERLVARNPDAADSVGLLTVSVDTDLFRPSPFALPSACLRIIYAGRLDAFKAPATMFRTIRHVADRLGGRLEFHYCGGGDPTAFPEFADIAPLTRLHGALSATQVAAVMRGVDMGMLVSHYEGMPCFLLELLSSGRPFAGVRQPQFDPLVPPDLGAMVDRAGSEEETAQAVAGAIVDLWNRVQAGEIDVDRLHRQILPWSTEQQLSRLYSVHRMLARIGTAPDSGGLP